MDIHEFREAIRVELQYRSREADFEQLLDEILNRSGLLRVINGKVEFRHHLLQEFFAGRGIPEKNHLEAIIQDQWWQRPIVFYFGENPDDSAAFTKIMATLTARTKPEAFHSALTLGLALQACYLVKTREKQDVLRWVIETLSDAKTEFLKETDPQNRFPLSRFTLYYLTGRDAVACDSLAFEPDAIRSALKRADLTQDEKDMRDFWVIVGLLECGELAAAEKALSDFDPRDMRLMLAIHLGCYLIANLKITTKEEKRIAERILKAIGHQVAGLRQQVIAEWKTELLEIRQGQLKAIEIPKSKKAESQAATA